MQVPYSTEPRKDDLGVPHMIGMTCDEVIQEAHAGEIVAIHDVINAPGDTFTDGLVRYTEASSIDISELLSRDSEQTSVDVSELVSRVSGVQVYKQNSSFGNIEITEDIWLKFQ
ncbi:hypothetical protein MtrunA17_Chr2g0291341 [Medicago truncatula]|uniref:Uncharacterized protein n=1 Tax=Medicago truncatula TaxID=3880 RepID=A0A396JC71_MEDTR|nr:hypothetical protein MtrunA17_Chr2g0291341 [Medicago truncatula]